MEIPREIPTGRTNVLIQIPIKSEMQPKETDKPNPIATGQTLSKKIGMTKKELDEFLKNAYTPLSDSLLGILENDMTIDEIRMARLAKQL